MATVIGGNDESCILLLHGEGLDGSIDIVDKAVGGLPKIISPVEQARISTADQKFGISSLYFDGGSAYVLVGASSDFRFNTADFTVDFWVNVSDPLRAYLFAWWLDDDNFLALERMTTNGTQVRFRLRFRQAGVDTFTAEGATVTAFDGWRHVAVTRSGDTTRLFIDGALYASDVQGSGDAYACNVQTWPLYIGGATWMGRTGVHYLHGFIDEFRILTGVAAWMANFTPYDNAYTPRFMHRLRGEHHVRRSFEQRTKGLYGVARHPFAQEVRGSHNVRGSFEVPVRGAYHIFAPFEQSVRGVHGVDRHPFRQILRGRYRIRQGYTQKLLGEFGIASGSFEQRVKGTFIIREGFEQPIRGRHNLRINYQQPVRGQHRIEDTTIEGYELFYGDGSEPDLTGAPWETFSSLPHDTAAISGEGLHYFVLRYRHRWNLSSENITSWVVELDGSDDEIVRAPSDPVNVGIAASANATARVTALYYYDVDPDRQADEWLIYITDDGTDPDPDIDTPVVEAMVKADGVAKLDWISPAYDDLDTAKAIVRTRRTTPARDSVSVAIVNVTVTTTAPDPVEVEQFQKVGGGPIPV